MCPGVVLCTGSLQIELPSRSKGGLTGTRTAGMMGRIPVEKTMIERRSHWRRWGFKAHEDVLCVCSHVDNLFSVSKSLQSAKSMLEDFGKQLEVNWDLKIKKSSRSCMISAGGPGAVASDKWPARDSFEVLGHTLQNTGSIRACWKHTRNKMWKSFWANPGSRDASALEPRTRIKLLDKAVMPQLSYRCPRWPPQKTIAVELNALQRRMVSSILRIPQNSGETAAEYVKRRGQNSGRHCTQMGKLSSRWFKRARNWNEHLLRARNRQSWPARLLHYKDAGWFVQRRLSFLPADCKAGSCLAGRTDTRAVRGCVHMRWHDGIAFSKQ